MPNRMRNLFKKLHASNSNPQQQQEDASEGSTASSRGSKLSDVSSSDHKTFSGISNWLNSVTSSRKSPSPPSSSNVPRGSSERMVAKPSESVSSSGCGPDPVVVVRDSGSRGPEIDEEYQIQLALEMSAIEDPEAAQIEAVKQISLGSSHPENSPAEVLAYRYWNYNALSYDDKILDGFYDLYGVLTDSRSDKMPSLLELQGTPVSESIMWEAVLVDKTADANLLKLEQKAREISVELRSESPALVDCDLVKRLATLVSNYMGGSVGDPENMSRAWRRLSYSLKATLGSMVLPLGSLTIGMARHRALMFKVFADSVGIPSRLVKGHQFTGSDDVVMNFVKLDDGREYIIDLMADPGTLIPSDAAGLNMMNDNFCFSASSLSSSHLASSSSGVASSFAEIPDSSGNLNLRFPIRGNAESRSSPDERRQNYPYAHARSPSWTEGITPAARKKKVKDVSRYMIDAAKENPQLAQKLHDVLLESGVNAPPSLFTEFEQLSLPSTEIEKDELPRPPPRFLPPLPQLQSETPPNYAKNVPVAAAAAAAAVVASSMVVAAARSNNADPNLELPVAAAAAAVMATSAAVSKKQDYGARSDGDADQEHDVILVNSEGERVSDRSTGNDSSRAADHFTLDDVAECEIPWEEITVGERIGLGSYGEVYHGEWHGTEVAVKKFLVQDISGELLAEFKSEVQIMKRLRHPNVVLFMGAVTRSPNLSIVTEFLPRGSLYRLLHRPNNQLDERRRLRMALDAARGMNYLHSSTPVIVHRDLKSPNLLVDKNWVVKVCDFGLSRMKHSTFLSSKSTAGTAEWMAPEVLRNEPSDEKCDVYSYGVILWELCTMQQPWGGMNPMQVVGAVGFQHRRLDIPSDMDPAVADIIRSCWQTDPRMRPSFAEIMAALKPLQKPTTTQVARSRERSNAPR